MGSDIVLAVFLIAVLLGLTSLLLPLARWLDVPYTVLLALAGVVFGLMAQFAPSVPWAPVLPWVIGPEVEGRQVLSLPSDVFLYVFLPPLLFAAAMGVNIRRLMDDIGPVIVLAVVGVGVCTAIVGFAVYAVAPQYGLLACLLLAAIVATTDSAAVVTIFRDLGAPTRLSIIVEGESLFNDAAAIAIFVVLLALMTGEGNQGLHNGLGALIFGLLGGIVVGYVMAWIFTWIIGYLRDAALTEITLTIALAYIAYILADVYLGVSGVVSVVTAGMILGSEGRTRVSPGTWASLQETWRLVDFVATSLIFTFAAMVVPQAVSSFSAMDFAILITLMISTILARVVVLYGLMPGLSLFNLSAPISGSYKAVLVWGGLRGAVTVALALSISENDRIPDDIQRFVLVGSTSFVFVTLLLAAPTIRPLMNAFGLTALGQQERVLRDRARRMARARARTRLKEAAAQLGLDGLMSVTASADVMPMEPISHRPSDISTEGRRQFAFMVLAGREREFYLDYYREGFLDRQITEELRAKAGRMVDAVKLGGRERYLQTAFEIEKLGSRFHAMRWLYHRLGISGPMSEVLSNHFETLMMMQLALRDLRHFAVQELVPLVGADLSDDIQDAIDQREEIVHAALEAFDVQFSTYAQMLRSRYIKRLALGFEGREYRAQRNQAVIGNEVYQALEDDRRVRLDAVETRPPLDLGLRLATMLQTVPILENVEEATLERIARRLVRRLVLPDEYIVRQGEKGDRMYFIVMGCVEVILPDRSIMLYSGDFFGEIALVTNEPRNADVRAKDICSLLSLSRRDFKSLARTDPELRRQIQKVAEERNGAQS